VHYFQFRHAVHVICVMRVIGFHLDILRGERFLLLKIQDSNERYTVDNSYIFKFKAG